MKADLHLAATLIASCVGLAACADVPRSAAPQVDAARSTQALRKLPRMQDDRVAVSLYESRSAVIEMVASRLQ